MPRNSKQMKTSFFFVTAPDIFRSINSLSKKKNLIQLSIKKSSDMSTTFFSCLKVERSPVSRNHVKEFLKYMNSRHPNIQFTCEGDSSDESFFLRHFCHKGK